MINWECRSLVLTADIWFSLWADGKTGRDDDTYAIVVYTSICGVVVLLSVFKLF